MVKTLQFPTNMGANRGYIAYLAVHKLLSQIKTNTSQVRSPLGSITYDPEYAYDGDVNTRYGSYETPSYGQYFQIQMPSPLKITGYSLQYINTFDTSPCHILKWNFSASRDGVTFDVLDTHDGDSTLKDSKPHIFSIDEDKQNIYSYFKVTNRGENGCYEKHLHISEIDLFGTVYQHESFIHTCLSTFKFRLHVFVLFFIF